MFIALRFAGAIHRMHASSAVPGAQQLNPGSPHDSSEKILAADGRGRVAAVLGGCVHPKHPPAPEFFGRRTG